MKLIDVRFTASDMAALKSMAGKKIIKYKCDPFEFSASVYGIVGIVTAAQSILAFLVLIAISWVPLRTYYHQVESQIGGDLVPGFEDDGFPYSFDGDIDEDFDDIF